MSIVTDRVELVQAGDNRLPQKDGLAAPLAADDHSKTKDLLPQRPRGPHPYRSVRVRGSAPADVSVPGLLAEQRHQLDSPALEAAFARLAPSVADGRWTA